MLSEKEAINLSQRLRQVLVKREVFERVLYEIATPVDIEVLETLIGIAEHELRDRAKKIKAMEAAIVRVACKKPD